MGKNFIFQKQLEKTEERSLWEQRLLSSVLRYKPEMKEEFFRLKGP